MRMYTLHFGQGREHTVDLENQSLQNFPTSTPAFSGGVNMVAKANTGNSRIISHREIFETYGVKGGHGEYCLETWRQAGPFFANATRLFMTQAQQANAMYIKFDFMYTNTKVGNILSIQREVIDDDDATADVTLSIRDGVLEVNGSQHRDPSTPPPDPVPNPEVWSARRISVSKTTIPPNEWHEIQIFIDVAQGYDVVSNVFLVNRVPGFTPAFVGYERLGSFRIRDAENDPPPHIAGQIRDLRLDPWPVNGQPLFPNAMLPGQDQSAWPPENLGSGQYVYGSGIGVVYVWIDGQLNIQSTLNMVNSRFSDQPFGSLGQSIWLGDNLGQGVDQDERINGRFFYDNIICNDMKDHAGSAPSKIFDPLFSSDTSLAWNPNYKLKFVAMEMEPKFWRLDTLQSSNNDFGRKHNTWLPEFPRGALVPSGDPFYVDAPTRFGSSTDSMIPHGTKLTIIHVDWNGDDQDYTLDEGNRSLYADYDIDFAYEMIQPNESNRVTVNQDDPRLTSQASGNKALFYLKRPLATSGKPHFAGGFGLGGPKNYIPTINRDINALSPEIYRIWTYIQDHTIGSNEPIDTQHHMIKVPSGVSGSVEFISDNPCPGDRGYRAYHNDLASSTNGYSMSDWPYNPVTNRPWTWEDLENLQIGVFHATHNGNNTAVVYTMYLVVEHATAIDPDVNALNKNLVSWAVADDIPYAHQSKVMYKPGWRFNTLDTKSIRSGNYNRWDISPMYTIDRNDRQTTDGQAIITGMQFSGTISFDYSIRYLNGEIVSGYRFRKFDEHFPEVWVYTIDDFVPSIPIRRPHRGEVITDSNGDKFTFLTYPVLQYNSSKFVGQPDSSPAPLKVWPYILYDLNTMYVVPLTTDRFADAIDPSAELRTWTNPTTRPSVSGSWTIQRQVDAFNFVIDKDSFFGVFSPSGVANHISTYPNEQLNTLFPPSRSGHDFYFRPANRDTSSVTQTIFLTDVWSLPDKVIDHELYSVHMGLWQTTVDQAINDTGEGRFDFYDGSIVPQLISGHTFGVDGTAGWHLNEIDVILPSGTRKVIFTYEAIRNTDGEKAPGGTFGGTSNFASFDEPFFVVTLAAGNTDTQFHPADINEDSRIESSELIEYISHWQSGLLPSGIAKDFVTKAEKIWQRGVSTHFIDPSGGLYSDSGGAIPDKWASSGLV